MYLCAYALVRMLLFALAIFWFARSGSCQACAVLLLSAGYHAPQVIVFVLYDVVSTSVHYADGAHCLRTCYACAGRRGPPGARCFHGGACGAAAARRECTCCRICAMQPTVLVQAPDADTIALTVPKGTVPWGAISPLFSGPAAAGATPAAPPGGVPERLGRSSVLVCGRGAVVPAMAVRGGMRGVRLMLGGAWVCGCGCALLCCV